MSGATTTLTPGASRRSIPLGKKGGDNDWYGYCVDDPVNRVDVWGLWSLFGFGDEGSASEGGQGDKPASTGRDDNPYCKWNTCDDNGTMQGDYKPVDVHEGKLPFLLQFGAFKPLVWPFQKYYELNKNKD